MINGLYDNIDLLKKGLDASWLRNKVIANNIANVDTPGFKASSVEFESEFKRALESGISLGRNKGVSLDNVTPKIVQNSDASLREDGNNVDIDHENIELAKNSILYNELVVQVSGEFKRLGSAIKG